MTTPNEGADALVAVRDAAVERALLDAADARRYLALAGTIERVREKQSAAGDVGPLAAALTCTLAVTKLRSADSQMRSGDSSSGFAGDRRTPTPSADAVWRPTSVASPRSAVDATPELVATGAVVAVRRFDADPETVAARAGLSRADLDARLGEDA